MSESFKRALETVLFLAGIVIAVLPISYVIAIGAHKVGLPTPAQAANGVGAGS